MRVDDLKEKYNTHLVTGNKLQAVAMLYNILKACRNRLSSKQVDISTIQLDLVKTKDLVDKSPTGTRLVKLLKKEYPQLFAQIRFIQIDL